MLLNTFHVSPVFGYNNDTLYSVELCVQHDLVHEYVHVCMCNYVWLYVCILSVSTFAATYVTNVHTYVYALCTCHVVGNFRGTKFSQISRLA